MSPSRIFLYTILAFIIGIGARLYIAIPVSFLVVPFLIACFFLMHGVLWRKGRFFVMALCAFACIAGITRVAYIDKHLQDLSSFTEKKIIISGVVRGTRITEKGQTLFVRAEEINGQLFTKQIGISVFLRPYPRYEEGDIIRAEGLFEPKPYDGKIFGMLFAKHEEKIGHKREDFFIGTLRKIRAAFEVNLDAVLPEPHAGFMKGLLLGEKTALPANLLEKFKITGTSHIIALSGYNITLVGALLVDLMLLATIPFWMTFWLAAASIILFVLMTGGASSLVRAAIMGILVLIASREGRSYHMTNALALAGALMLAINPYVLRFDIGFQLSFLATLGLIYLTPLADRTLSAVGARIQRMRGITRLHKEHSRVSLMRKITSETLAAQLAVLPYVVYLFGGVSLIAPISNLFVLIAVPFAMALGFFTGVAGFIWHPLSQFLGWGAWIVLEYELRIINLFARIPFSFVSISWLGFISIIVLYFFIVWQYGKKVLAKNKSAL